MVKMGPSVPIMAVSMADDMVMAMRKVICGTKRPSSEAATIFQKSPRSTFSCGRKSDSSQNRALAPMALRVNSAYGDTVCELAMSLQNTTLRPKIV